MSNNRIIYSPAAKHRCNIGWEQQDIDGRQVFVSDKALTFAPAGTVVACGVCKATWVARYLYGNALAATWHKESKFERFLRENNLVTEWRWIKIGLALGVMICGMLALAR